MTRNMEQPAGVFAIESKNEQMAFVVRDVVSALQHGQTITISFRHSTQTTVSLETQESSDLLYSKVTEAINRCAMWDSR